MNKTRWFALFAIAAVLTTITITLTPISSVKADETHREHIEILSTGDVGGRTIESENSPQSSPEARDPSTSITLEVPKRERPSLELDNPGFGDGQNGNRPP